jgi:hypothetical protein
MYAFNESPYRGAYMTDIIKGEIEAKSNRLKERIQLGQVDVEKHISAFRFEMDELGVNKDALFILFGGDVKRLFAKWLACTYPNYAACSHYSRRGTDAEWVEDSWAILEEHYVTTRAQAKTLQFSPNDSMSNQLQKLKLKQYLRLQVHSDGVEPEDRLH